MGKPCNLLFILGYLRSEGTIINSPRTADINGDCPNETELCGHSRSKE